MNQIIWNSFELKKTQQEIWNEFLYPALGLAYDSAGIRKPGCNKLFNGNYIKAVKTMLERMARATRNPENNLFYTPENHPYLRSFRQSWQNYLERYPEAQDELEVIASQLCSQTYQIRFEHRGFFFDFNEALQSLSDTDILQKLSKFSAIACTWPIWVLCSDCAPQGEDEAIQGAPAGFHRAVSVYRGMLLQLARILFPSVQSPFTPSGGDAVHLSEQSESQCADELFQSALAFYENSQFAQAGPLFAELVTFHLTEPPQRLAEACDYLIKCCDNGYQRPEYLSSRKDLEKMAEYYGSTSVTRRTHAILQEVSRSRAQTNGRCILNCENSISDWVRQTAPAQWNVSVSSLPHQHWKPESDTRFVLIDDNFEKNTKDALLILEAVRQIAAQGDLTAEQMGQIEIIIRCKEEAVSALLDTAYSFLEEEWKEEDASTVRQPIRIYPLDEEKRTADMLYARHPLFYPLTVPYSGQKKGLHRNCNHLVIVSDNENLDYVCWLVREAFWLLPRGSSRFSSKITVFSPFAREIAWQVTASCPGFAPFSSVLQSSASTPEQMQSTAEVEIDDILFPAIEYQVVSLQSRAFQTQVEKLSNQGESLYCVADSGSDFATISLGVKIRELMIRRTVLRTELGRDISKYSADAAVVAVRCEDPDFAGLAEDLIVPKEPEREMAWNHSYRLLTFGSKKDLYSWDELTGGVIEDTSWCIHRQYCSQGNSLDFSAEPKQEDVWNYFRRLYNHDSSFAAAVGMPYRLFEAGVMPEPWDIRNPEALWSEKSREKLAQEYDKAKKNPGIIDHLARYEHTRWCCYMLSRGWLPVNPDQTSAYMNAGVNRHVLQIAKLHPCLVSWEDLKLLYSNLHSRYLGRMDSFGKRIYNERFLTYAADDAAYFQRIDLNNIKQTGDILRAAPQHRQANREETER